MKEMMMMVNVPNLLATVARVEAQPQHYDQRYYAQVVDGVVKHCFAGHAAILAGDPPALRADSYGILTVSGRFTYDVVREWWGLHRHEVSELINPFVTWESLLWIVNGHIRIAS